MCHGNLANDPRNNRQSGSGCTALGALHPHGCNLGTAALGDGQVCFAVQPGDMAVPMRVLDATVETLFPDVSADRSSVADIHQRQGNTPHHDTALQPGAKTTAVRLPAPVRGAAPLHWCPRTQITQVPRLSLVEKYE